MQTGPRRRMPITWELRSVCVQHQHWHWRNGTADWTDATAKTTTAIQSRRRRRLGSCKWFCSLLCSGSMLWNFIETRKQPFCLSLSVCLHNHKNRLDFALKFSFRFTVRYANVRSTTIRDGCQDITHARIVDTIRASQVCRWRAQAFKPTRSSPTINTCNKCLWKCVEALSSAAFNANENSFKTIHTKYYKIHLFSYKNLKNVVIKSLSHSDEGLPSFSW